MRLPIRNKTEQPFMIFIEPWCDEYELLPGGEAFVDLEDGHPHSIDVWEGQITIWNEGGAEAKVACVPEEQHCIAAALGLARSWLYRLDAKADAETIDRVVAGLEKEHGYLGARAEALNAFFRGFQAKAAETAPADAALPPWTGAAALAPCYDAGSLVVWQSRRRRGRWWPFAGRDFRPNDTSYLRAACERAMVAIDGLKKAGTLKGAAGSSPA